LSAAATRRRLPVAGGANLFQGEAIMKIVEGLTVAQEPVWIVIVSAVEGEEVRVAFHTKADATAYRNACLALRRVGPNTWQQHLDMVRQHQRSSLIS
jgi:hypothetical protein